MNPRQTYLAWVRTQYPTLYWRGITRTFSPRSGMSGLGDDLTSSISPDLATVGIPTDVGVTSDVTDAINNATAAAQSQPSTDWFSSIVNGITAIAPTVIQTQAAENLLQINSQRAAQGLPPLTANGIPVTAAMLSPTSSTVAQMEAALAGSSSLMLPIVLIGGLALLFAATSK